MKTTTNKFLLGLLAVGALTLNSCKKEEAVVTKNDNTKAVTFDKVAAKQAKIAGETFQMTNFLSSMVRKANVGFKTSEDDSIPCLTYTVDSSGPVRTLTLDFGGLPGCKSVNGVDYAGTVVIEYTQTDLGVSGAAFTATFTDFSIDLKTFNGQMSVSNQGTSGGGNPLGRITTSLATNFSHNALEFAGTNTFDFEFVENNPADEFDNIVTFTGTGNGTTTDGFQFIQTITTPLIFNTGTGCVDYPATGHMLLQSPTMPDRDINYDNTGNADCDNIATVTGAFPSYNIVLQ